MVHNVRGEKRERRSAPRAEVTRRIKFEAVDGSTLPQEGTVVNLSTDGLRVHTRFPAPLGCIIEVQVEPRPDAPDQIAIQARGRVTYVTPIAAKGEFAMGVRLRWGVSPDARIGPARKHRTSKTFARQTTDLGQPVGEPDEESPVR
jgi:hypothetical protein